MGIKSIPNMIKKAAALYNTLNYICNADNNVYFGLLNNDNVIRDLGTCRGSIIDNLFEQIYEDKNSQLENIQMLIAVSDNNSQTLLPVIKDLINQIEDHMGLPKTTIEEIDINKKHTSHLYLLTNNEVWFNNPFAISFYMFLIRGLSRYHTIGVKFYKTFNKYYNKAIAHDRREHGFNYENGTYANCDYDFCDFIGAYEFIKKILRCGFKPFFYDILQDNYLEVLYENDETHDYGMASIGSGEYNYDWGDYSNYSSVKYAHRFDKKEDKELKSWLRKHKLRMNKKVDLV